MQFGLGWNAPHTFANTRTVPVPEPTEVISGYKKTLYEPVARTDL
jgi:hypothetical protein